MSNFDRRQFTATSLGSLLTFTLLESLARNDLFANEIKPITAKWVADLNQLGMDLKDKKLGQTEWQQKVEELYAKVDLPDLLTLVDFDRLSQLPLPENGARSIRFQFEEIAGIPTKLVFGKQIFGLKKGRSVVPHGHDNMATAFLILKGKLHGRHYDRLADEPEHFIIRPTIDRSFGPGEASTISDEKDNVHWFEAQTEPAYIFNIHVLNLKPNGPAPTGRVYLDPMDTKLDDGTIRARRIGYTEAHKLYG